MKNKNNKNRQPHKLNGFCRIVGGKCYENGNHIMVLPQHREIVIEFDSDYNISKKIVGKNFEKAAKKEIARIPNLVTPHWFYTNGWNVPEQIL